MFRVGSQVVMDKLDARLSVPPYCGLVAGGAVVVVAFGFAAGGDVVVAGALDVVLGVLEVPHEASRVMIEIRHNSSATCFLTFSLQLNPLHTLSRGSKQTCYHRT